jgi:hypothetical protein
MSCACKDSSSTFVLQTSTSEYRPRFIGTVIAVIEAFQATLAMRRDAQRIHFLGDE